MCSLTDRVGEAPHAQHKKYSAYPGPDGAKFAQGVIFFRHSAIDRMAMTDSGMVRPPTADQIGASEVSNGPRKTNRHGHRDTTMLLVAYRHGLRASELCGLEWSQVDFNGATLHVRRAKNGKAATHPIRGDEMRALRKLQREAPKSPFVFVNERGAPFSPDGFNWLVKRTGQKAGLPFQVHAHMLRHSAGYKLAGDGHDTRAIQDYLGHRNISNTVRYTELSPTRFKNFWRD